jgi:hypothetical protein
VIVIVDGDVQYSFTEVMVALTVTVTILGTG